MHLITIDHVRFLRLWDAKARKTPRDVALTTAEMEDGSATPWGMLNIVAERFEQGDQQRAIDARDAGSHKWDSYGYEAWHWTSFGMFQIMGFNLRDLGFEYLRHWHETMCAGQPYANGVPWEQAIDDVASAHMACYDKHMSRLIRLVGLPNAFRRYNGAGDAARAYMIKAIGLHARACDELHTTRTYDPRDYINRP